MNFLGLDTSPKLDTVRDELILTDREKKLKEIEEGLEDASELSSLSYDLEDMSSDLNMFINKLPGYVNAYQMVTNNLVKVADYQAGLEDNVEMDNVYKEVTFIAKHLNIRIEELDYGLLDSDPDDTTNTNILIRIVKKIFNIIIGLVKNIVNIIVKIVNTFFKYIKRLLGISDPAAKIKKRVEETEKKMDKDDYNPVHISSVGGGGFDVHIPAERDPYTNIKKSNDKIKDKHNERTNDTSKTDETNKDIKDADDKLNKLPGTTMGPAVKEMLEENPVYEESKELKEQLELREAAVHGIKNYKLTDQEVQTIEDLKRKIENEYPLPILIANNIFEMENEKTINVIDVLAVLYSLTISLAKTNINCDSKLEEFTIENHLYYFIKNISEINTFLDGFKNFIKARLNNSRRAVLYENDYMVNPFCLKLTNMVDKIVPIYDMKDDSVIASIRKFISSIANTVDKSNITFNKIIDLFLGENKEYKKIALSDVINPVLKQKIGDTMYDSITSYIPVNNVSDGADSSCKNIIKNEIENSGYKFCRSAVLTVDSKNIEILVHLTNVRDLETAIHKAGLPDTSKLMHGNTLKQEEIDKYKEFFAEKLPQIADDIKGKIIKIVIEVSREDLIKQFNLVDKKEIDDDVIYFNSHSTEIIASLERLSKALAVSVDDIEKCINKTDKVFKKFTNTLNDLEKGFNKLIKYIEVNSGIYSPVTNEAYVKEVRSLAGKDAKITPLKNAVLDKKEMMESIKKTILYVSQMLHVTTQEVIQIYKTDIIDNLKILKELSADNTIAMYINSLENIFDRHAGIK